MNISTIAIVSLAITMPVMASGLIDGPGEIVSQGPIVSACSITDQGGQAVLTATVPMMPVLDEAGRYMKYGDVKGDAARHGVSITAAASDVDSDGVVTGAGPGAAPHVRSAAKENAIEVSSWQHGVSFSVAPSPGGGMPVVHAMAINEKGTGITGRSQGLLLPAVQKGRDAAARMAINTKGTGASNGRGEGLPPGAVGKIREAANRMKCSNVLRRESGTPLVASCSVSGNPDAPDITFSLPVSAFDGFAREGKLGHVTLMKRTADGATRATATLADGSSVVATCDSSKLGDRMIATYDLKMAKK